MLSSIKPGYFGACYQSRRKRLVVAVPYSDGPAPIQDAPTVYQTEWEKSGKAGQGGVFGTVETYPNPSLPWPQPGDTSLPGWGDRDSMEYRLRVASEDECLEWAKELWQLDLVAKARGYPKKLAVQTSRNRLMWREAFAARDECRVTRRAPGAP
jgi:hypothetical protein